MNITYREFTAQDAEAIKELLVKIAEYIATVNPGRLATPTPEYRDSYYQRLLKIHEEGRGTIFLAFDGDLAIGFVQGEVINQDLEDLMEFKPLVEGYMRDIYVRDEYRGQGIGDNLLKMLEAYLKNKGCSQYELYVYHTNPALDFYKRRGFTDQVFNLIKKL